MFHAQSSFDARARSTHVLTPQRSGPRSRARSAFRLLMHARHASVLTHLCVHDTCTSFDAHASCSPRSPRHARLSTLTPCSSRRLPVFANALRRSRFRSLQPETAFRQLQTAARRFGVHETCSSFDAHVRVRRWVPTSVNRLSTFTSCSPSRCLRSCSVFRRLTFASTFGSLRRSFTFRGRAHVRLTTFMTASTSCERSSALRLRVHGSCSLRSIGRAHHRDAFRARLLGAHGVVTSRGESRCARLSTLAFELHSRGVSLCARLSTLASRSAVGSQSTGSRIRAHVSAGRAPTSCDIALG